MTVKRKATCWSNQQKKKSSNWNYQLATNSDNRLEEKNIVTQPKNDRIYFCKIQCLQRWLKRTRVEKYPSNVTQMKLRSYQTFSIPFWPFWGCACETGSIMSRIALWDCFEGRILDPFYCATSKYPIIEAIAFKKKNPMMLLFPWHKTDPASRWTSEELKNEIEKTPAR